MLANSKEYFQIKPTEKSELRYRDDIRDEITRWDAEFDVGLGYKFGRGEGVNLSLRLSQGFVNTLRDKSLPAEYNRGFHVQVGIPIGVGKEDVKQKIE